MNDNPPKRTADDAPNGAAPLDEELVAYLDGELDAESGRRIEALLASDPAVRNRLQSLERTWDLLDELDAAPLGEPFTQTTLEMVAIAARQDAERSRADAPRRRRRLALAVGAGLLAAAAAGFFAVALHNPDRQLLQDLPMLENLDEYRQIGSIEFLHRLRDDRLFSKDAADLPKTAAEDDEDIATRRHRIENMTLDQKEQLLRTEDRFTRLAPAEQQRLRRLHEDLQNDADAPQLRAVMHSYYEWLRPLLPLTWADLAEGEPDKRIALVKELQEQQRREGGERPGAEDMAELRNWMSDCAARHEADFLKSLPTEQDRQKFLESGSGFQQRTLREYWARHWLTANSGKLPPMMTAEDLARLRGNDKLSQKTRKRLEEKKTPAEQWQQVAAWMRPGFRRPFEERRMRGAPPLSLDDEHLAEFFEKLPRERRDWLLSMPGEDMQAALQEMYFDSRLEAPSWRGRRPSDPEGPPPPNRSGPPPRPRPAEAR